MQMQGQSFKNDTQKQVEELKINLHSNIQPRKTYEFKSLLSNFEEHQINVHKCSMYSYEKIMMVDHPVLTGYYLAFLDHYPVVLSPDILWMLILQGFSRHVKLNHQKLRNKFVKVNTDNIVVTHKANGDQIWIIGCINNLTKDFRIEAAKNRNSNTLKNFITSYIDSGNKIITDGWSGYLFLNSLSITTGKPTITGRVILG